MALAMLICFAFGAVAAQAETEVKMSGDARIYANFWSQYNYTGWDALGKQTYDSATVWERFRLKTDFIANEGLKFRLAIRVNDTPWGNSTFTVDNPAVTIQVYQAFLQFKWPNTDVQFTVGMQDMDLPLSVDWLGANPVLGGTRSAAAVFDIPVVDQLKVVGGFSRLVDGNKNGFGNNTNQTSPDLDAYFLTLPITLDGFQATPWGMVAVAGRNAPYATTYMGNGGPNTNETLASNLFSLGTSVAPGLQNSENTFWWVGTTMTVTALDPFKFYADIMYGSGMGAEHQKDHRSGWFGDVAAEYTGLDMVTPQLTFWYGSGEDGGIRGGSHRMPSVVNYWGPSNSFLFDTNQEFNYGQMPTNSAGSWGAVFALDKISFIKDLTHRLTFSYARGTNSPNSMREANLLTGVGSYVMMGRDLTFNEYSLGINFDNTYDIYENLALILETGWAHGDFQKSVWGRRFVNQANDGDAWKAAIGLKYKF
jgi:hypothetical protein